VICISPSGLTFITDKVLNDPLADMQCWKDGCQIIQILRDLRHPKMLVRHHAKLIIIMLMIYLGILHLLSTVYG